MLQKGWKIVICPKEVTVSNLWWESTSLCKFATSGGATFKEIGNFEPILTPILPPVCPQEDQNLWFVLNEWQYHNCDEKLYLCANLQLLRVVFIEKWANFDLFDPTAPRVPQKGLKNVLTKINATIELLMQNYVSISIFNFQLALCWK